MTDVLAVSITKLYDGFVQENGREPFKKEIYEMARWAWRGPNPCRIVFACVHGKIKAVFKVREWFSCGDAKNRPELRPCVSEGSRRYHEIEVDIKENTRKAFVGDVASCAKQFVEKRAPRLYGPFGYTKVEC